MESAIDWFRGNSIIVKQAKFQSILIYRTWGKNITQALNIDRKVIKSQNSVIMLGIEKESRPHF